ncbi:MAG: ABC transporter substrate-binding protein, partial [Cyanobacteria bacterium J06592_8]
MKNIYPKITATFATTAILSAAIAFGSSQAEAATFECTDAIGCVTIAPDQPIDIGVLLTFSGSLASIGNETLQAFELAILQRDNQLLGRSIQLFPEDEMCTPEGGAEAATTVVGNPQLIGIYGTLCSASGVTASEISSNVG